MNNNCDLGSHCYGLGRPGFRKDLLSTLYRDVKHIRFGIWVFSRLLCACEYTACNLQSPIPVETITSPFVSGKYSGRSRKSEPGATRTVIFLILRAFERTVEPVPLWQLLSVLWPGSTHLRPEYLPVKIPCPQPVSIERTLKHAAHI